MELVYRTFFAVEKWTFWGPNYSELIWDNFSSSKWGILANKLLGISARYFAAEKGEFRETNYLELVKFFFAEVKWTVLETNHLELA